VYLPSFSSPFPLEILFLFPLDPKKKQKIKRREFLPFGVEPFPFPFGDCN
jgi:hypothetical protein